MYELINDVPLEIKEYKGQRVVTFRDIDTVHGRPEGTAKRNFNANREYFIEGVDYFKVCADEIRTHKIIDLSPKAHEDITLMTLNGYLMIAKSLTDDLSWSIQRLLVNSYFRVQEQNQNYNDLLQKYNDLASRIATLESKQAKTRKKIEQNCYLSCSIFCILSSIALLTNPFIESPFFSAISLIMPFLPLGTLTLIES